MKKGQLRLKPEPKSRPQLMSTPVTSTSDTITENRIENVTEGLSSQYFNVLHRMLPVNKENVLTICDYIFP